MSNYFPRTSLKWKIHKTTFSESGSFEITGRNNKQSEIKNNTIHKVNIPFKNTLRKKKQKTCPEIQLSSSERKIIPNQAIFERYGKNSKKYLQDPQQIVSEQDNDVVPVKEEASRQQPIQEFKIKNSILLSHLKMFERNYNKNYYSKRKQVKTNRQNLFVRKKKNVQFELNSFMQISQPKKFMRVIPNKKSFNQSGIDFLKQRLNKNQSQKFEPYKLFSNLRQSKQIVEKNVKQDQKELIKIRQMSLTSKNCKNTLKDKKSFLLRLSTELNRQSMLQKISYKDENLNKSLSCPKTTQQNYISPWEK